MAKAIKNEKFDNLSELQLKLRELDASENEDDQDLQRAREELIKSLGVYLNSRYHLGRSLWGYRQLFKVERNWTAAAVLIASAIKRDKRTVFRIIEDYERAKQLPPTVIRELLDRNVDPAEQKNAAIVDRLIQFPEPKNSKQATENVARVVATHSIAKRQKKALVKTSASAFEAFVAKLVKQFEDRYRSATPEQKETEVRYLFELVNCTLRLQIRELQQFSRPALVPKPGHRRAA